MSGTTLLSRGPAKPALTVRRRRAAATIGAAGIVAVSFLLRAWLLNYGRGFASSDGYDDGVYWAAAAALVHGRLPYRDFLLLHPPGIVLALSPFAALGSLVGDPVAVGIARIVFMGIGAANTALVIALGRRHSWRAGLLAGTVAAVSFPLAFGERSTLLEPLGNLLVLAATLLVTGRCARRSLLLAGMLAGAAVMVKIWYVVPLLLLVVDLRGRAGRFVLGAAAAAVVAGLPFLLADPSSMVREVLLDQLGRTRSPQSMVHRVVLIAGDPFAGFPLAGGRPARAVTGLLVLGWLTAAAAALRLRAGRLPLAQAIAAVIVLLASPSFFLHYAAFALPWLAVTAGIGGAAITERMPAKAGAGLACAAAVAVVAVNAPADLHAPVPTQPVVPLRAVLANRPGCVISDDPGLLADLDVLNRDLGRGCPLWPDVTGWTYDRDRGGAGSAPISRTRNAAWQRDVLHYLLSGNQVVVARGSTGLSPESRRLIDQLPVLGRAGRYVVHAVP